MPCLPVSALPIALAAPSGCCIPWVQVRVSGIVNNLYGNSEWANGTWTLTATVVPGGVLVCCGRLLQLVGICQRLLSRRMACRIDAGPRVLWTGRRAE